MSIGYSSNGGSCSIIISSAFICSSDSFFSIRLPSLPTITTVFLSSPLPFSAEDSFCEKDICLGASYPMSHAGLTLKMSANAYRVVTFGTMIPFKYLLMVAAVKDVFSAKEYVVSPDCSKHSLNLLTKTSLLTICLFISLSTSFRCMLTHFDTKSNNYLKKCCKKY